MPPKPERKNKNYIRFDIFKAGVSITGSVNRERGHVDETITWQETENGLTIPQAREYMDAMIRCVKWAESQGAGRKGAVGRPGRMIETDNLTYIKRLLLHSDDTLFVEVRRETRAFGLISKPRIWIDGASRDMASTMQAARSIGQAIEDAMEWR